MKYIVTLNGFDYEVEVNELSEAIVTSVTPTAIAPAPVAATPTPAPAPVAATPAPAAAPAAVGEGTKVVAPMPGTLLSVNVSQGQAVKEGDVLFILEAMKMENEIVAPCAGTVSQVIVSKGSTVATDEVLAVIG